MVNNKLITSSILVLGALTLFLTLNPQLDISVSNYFFDPAIGFTHKDNLIVRFFFKIIPIFTKIFAASCLGYMVYLYIKHRNFKIIMRASVFFLFIAAITGPGLVVNTMLKDNFGRARPKQIKEFNGQKEFTPAFVLTDQCRNNCSFSSGHAAMAFYFTALAYIINSIYFSRAYLLGITLGFSVGLSRIIMGGHFASDVVTSGFIILLINHLIFICWKKRAIKSII